MNRPTRRDFMGTAVMGLAAAGSIQPAAAAPGKPQLCVFSKQLQWLDYDGMAEAAAELGFDGIDLTVRPGGHVEPADVARDLPRAVKAVQARKIEVPLIATAVVDPDDPVSRTVLETAADQGIRYYRTGYFYFTARESLDATLERARESFARLARFNEQLGLVGDYQNHAGEGYLGASLWDLWYVLKDLDPRWLGCQFDLRHAVVEGGEAWPIDFRRIKDRVHTLVAKDFRWRIDGQRAVADNCPLGEGVTPFGRFFTSELPAEFAGPITIHLEYELGGANEGARTLHVDPSVVKQAMGKDLEMLRGWLAGRNA